MERISEISEKKKKERKKEDSRRDAVPKNTPNESFIPNVN